MWNPLRGGGDNLSAEERTSRAFARGEGNSAGQPIWGLCPRKFLSRPSARRLRLCLPLAFVLGGKIAQATGDGIRSNLTALGYLAVETASGPTVCREYGGPLSREIQWAAAGRWGAVISRRQLQTGKEPLSQWQGEVWGAAPSPRGRSCLPGLRLCAFSFLFQGLYDRVSRLGFRPPQIQPLRSPDR